MCLKGPGNGRTSNNSGSRIVVSRGGHAVKIHHVAVVMAALVLQTALGWSAEPIGGQNGGIQWVTNFDEALARAKIEKKPVYLDFFNPN
jgi:hypothetical protein